jgi:hypothetical protein
VGHLGEEAGDGERRGRGERVWRQGAVRGKQGRLTMAIAFVHYGLCSSSCEMAGYKMGTRHGVYRALGEEGL